MPASVPQTGREARLLIRAGGLTGQTAGVAPGYVQGNLAILPERLAGDFLRFCQLNPKPCPLLAASAPGDWRLPTLAEDLDIRTDLPRYRVFPQRRADRRADRHPRPLARRSRRLRARLLVLVRGGAGRGRHRAAPHHLQRHRADVSHLDRHRARRPVPRPDGRVDAADEAGRRDPRHPDHHALPGGARRAGAYRQARADRHRRPDEARLRATRRRSTTTRSRCSGPAASRRNRWWRP